MHRVASVALCVVVALVACKPKKAPATEGSGSAPVGSGPASGSGSGSGSGSSAAPTVAPEARAREFLQHQIDLALKNDHDGFNATFAPGTAVFLHNKPPQEPDDMASGVLGGTGPDGASITRTTISKLVAGGNADAVWFYAEVTVSGEGPNDQPGTNRAVELVTAGHAVAASFDEGGEIQGGADNVEVQGATPADGPLAKLVAPSALAGALAPDAILVGPKSTTDIAGLKALEPVALYKGAKEVRNATFGYLQGTLDHARPGGKGTDRLNVQLFAVPNPDKSWKVVLAQYSGQ